MPALEDMKVAARDACSSRSSGHVAAMRVESSLQVATLEQTHEARACLGEGEVQVDRVRDGSLEIGLPQRSPCRLVDLVTERNSTSHDVVELTNIAWPAIAFV